MNGKNFCKRGTCRRRACAAWGRRSLTPSWRRAGSCIATRAATASKAIWACRSRPSPLPTAVRASIRLRPRSASTTRRSLPSSAHPPTGRARRRTAAKRRRCRCSELLRRKAHPLWPWRRRCRLRGRQRVGEPKIPAVRPVRRRELLIGFAVHVSLEVHDGNGIADLPAGAGNARLEATHSVSGPAIAARLIVEVAHQADLEPLGQKPRRAPIEMHIDAVLILGGRIEEVVS